MRRTATHTPVSVEELVGACLDGASLLVEIAGEPGSGRTRLLGELAAGARRGGLLVAHGLQVVRASPGRGVVRCLDDLDRAGPETAEPLRRLLAERPTVPTVITYTVSTGQPPIWLVSCLAAASDSYRTHRIPVGPLTPEDFAAQLPPGTGPMREGLLYELSGGVPGWLGVLSHLTSPQLRELATADHPPGTVPLPANCPPLRALDGLAPEQIEVVRCAAVLGDPFAPALVAAVADRATHAVLSVLDDLVARDLIRAVDGGAPLFRFRHPLLRTLLYARTPPGRRITAHTRAAEALDRVGAPLVQRAPHLARSAEQGDRRTACLLARAARNVLDTRPATAASWLRAALRILPDDDSADPDGPGDPEGIRPAERFRIAALLYHAAERTGQYAECRRLLPALLEAAGNDATPATCPGDLLDRTLIVDLHTRLESDLGRGRLARALLDAELAADPRPGARGERVLLLRKAAMAAAEGDLPATRRHVHQALRHADRAPDVLRVDAAATLALAGAMAGDPPRPAGTDGADGILDAIRMADALGDPELAGRLDAVARLGWALNLAERHGDALRLLTRALGIARRTGRVAALPPLLLGRGYGHAALGGLSAALRDTREAEETALLLGDGERAGWARVLRAWTTLWCEGPDGAADLADHVLRQHPGPGALGRRRPACSGGPGWPRGGPGSALRWYCRPHAVRIGRRWPECGCCGGRRRPRRPRTWARPAPGSTPPGPHRGQPPFPRPEHGPRPCARRPCTHRTRPPYGRSPPRWSCRPRPASRSWSAGSASNWPSGWSRWAGWRTPPPRRAGRRSGPTGWAPAGCAGSPSTPSAGSGPAGRAGHPRGRAPGAGRGRCCRHGRSRSSTWSAGGCPTGRWPARCSSPSRPWRRI